MKKVKQLSSKAAIYEVDFPIKIGRECGGENIKIKDCYESIKKKLKPEYKLIDSIGETTKFFVVSDARAHIERLVFAAFEVINTITGEKTFACDLLHIAGRNTFMIYGGDFSTIKEPVVYMRYLRKLNGSLKRGDL